MAAHGSTQPPRIDDLRLGRLDHGDPADLTGRADLDSVRYADLTLGHLDLGSALLSTSELVNVTADEADLRGARLSEVVLDRVRLPVVYAARSQWRDVRVSGRLGSVEAYEAQWRSVLFVGCKITYLNLRAAEVLDVAFQDCVVEELDLVDARVRRLALVDTRVAHLDVQHSELHDVDLRGATLDVIDGVMDLRGATITPEQLTLLSPLLAEGLGLSVEP